MLQVGKIKLRDIKELQEDVFALTTNALTPLRKRKNAKSVTSCKKFIDEEGGKETVIDCDNAATTTLTRTSRKRLLKSALKETPSNQKRIDSYFTSCPKNYEIKVPKEEAPKIATTKTKDSTNTKANKKTRKSARGNKGRRKRLFTDSTEPSTESISCTNSIKGIKNQAPIEYIIIDSDSEQEHNTKKEAEEANVEQADADSSNMSLKSSSATTASSLSFGLRMSKTSGANTVHTEKSSTNATTFSRRKPKPCPPYKVIENTTFAVDAFQFGYIENVTDYFLTHFHADHYIGLTKSFAMPLWMSSITARLLRTFISVEEQYIHELELNKTYEINDIEVTTLDANHCPGAVLIVFKFPNGKCVLHTGDFRACHEMESEPIFWNNNIHTVYLDTTYISEKYAFCTQYESIMKAQDLIEKFLEKNGDKRVLYICGSYMVGKEKFWSSLAEKYDMKVWAEGNRYKALKAMDEKRFNRFLVKDPKDANMHVIPIGKLSYLALVEYFKLYEDCYDMVFAMRPSGWEKDAKPRFGNKITIVGIEYSEHSSYMEMQRFVKYLKPKQVISTVPRSKDLMKTAKVPTSWYKYDTLKPSSNYQPTIDSFMSKTPLTKSSIRFPNINKGGVEYFVSPLKSSYAKDMNGSLNQHKKCSTVSFKPAESAQEICENNVQEHRNKNNTKNLRSNKNKAAIKKKHKLVYSTSSSEDFEKSDLVIRTKNNNFQIRSKTKKPTQTKPLRNKKQLTPKNIITPNTANPKESLESPEVKRKKKNNSQTENKVLCNTYEETTNFLSLNYSSSENESEIPLVPACETIKTQDLQIPTSQKRMTRSGTALTKLTNSFECPSEFKQTLQYDKQFNSKAQPNTTTYQDNLSYKSLTNLTIDSKSHDEGQRSAKSINQQHLEIPIPLEKRMTRSKTSAIKTTTRSSSDYQNKVENVLTSESLKLTELNDKMINSKSKLDYTTAFNTSQENAIFKSTTNSMIDPASSDEIQMMKSLKSKKIKLDSPTSSENDGFHQFEYPTTSKASKTYVSNNSVAAFKSSKDIIDTKAILSSIIKQTQDIDRINCSQLAGLVVETLNERNPDNSKNHIPPELLSDADDDWM